MAASTSTAAHSNNNSCYNVFISHRGPDVKKTFASHMYHRLIAYGLRVFLDYQVLQEGEEFPCQIESAIRTASVQIAIFSPTYADSQWCLDELVLMLETRAHIIPVFYHVKPTELRRTQGEGVYATSLRNLEKKRKCGSEPRHDSKTIENWRNALSRVADISGFDLDEGFNGDEGKLLDQLVKAVLEKGIKKLNVARYPTGLEEKVEDFETKLSLQQHSERVQFVGITGLGGAGKTTLAKELFNRKSSRYSKSCFLLDVRENVKNSVASLQRKLLKDLSGSEERIDSKDEGLEILRKHFSVLSAPVLLVLDDVDHQDQVYALLPVTDKGILPLPPSSLILITARDKNVLTRSGVQEPSIYTLTGLNTERSRELFCSHAFSQPHPMPGFKDLVNQFLKACNGLPLSIKVFGSLLYGNTNKSYWKDELEELRKALPDEIQKSLQVSYDALPREEQQIFLDIACFFIGESRDTAIRVWDASGWNGSRGFENLLSKSLVELDIIVEYPFPMYEPSMKYGIRMHDHLRDMGRYLANNTPGFPCRLWRGTKHIEDLLQQSSEATKVRGIRMLHWKHYYDERADSDSDSDVDNERADSDSDSDVDNELASFSRYKMKNLQLLDIDMEEDHLKCLLDGMDSPNLLWFRWRNCRCPSLPPFIPMKKLWVLEVEDLQTPSRLRELRIRVHVLHKIPKSIGQLKHLELMTVDIWAGDTVEIPKEFCDLRSLKHLVLRNLKLRSLPVSFGNLSRLEHINLSYCSALERLPDSFGNLSKLEHINLSYCWALERLPDSFGNLSKLEHINLSSCAALKRLPDSFGHLSKLEHIDLSYCRALEKLPDSFGNLSKLEHINLSYCGALKRLPDSFGDLIKLKYINLLGCHKLTIPGGTFRKITLEYMRFPEWRIEVLPPQIAHQWSLEKLLLCLINMEEWPSATGESSHLEKLVLETPFLEELPPSFGRDLRNLKHLKLQNCQSLKRLPDSFLLMDQLTKLTVEDCPLQEMHFPPSFGRDLRNLKYLELRSCQGLKRLPDSVLLMDQLTKLIVEDCPLQELHFPPSFGRDLRNLKYLELRSCQSLKRLPDCFLLMDQLTKLIVKDCPLQELYFETVEGGSETMIHSGGQGTLSNLERGLLRLHHLELHKTQISEISFPTGVCNNLQYLDIRDCQDLVEVGTLPNALIKLKVYNCSKLRTIGASFPTVACPNLKDLDIRDCNDLEQVTFPKALINLKLYNCSKLRQIPASFSTGVCPNLQDLDIRFCQDLVEVTLPNVPKMLTFYECSNLRKIDASFSTGVCDIRECEDLAEVMTLQSAHETRIISNFSKLRKIGGSFPSGVYPKVQYLFVEHCENLVELEILPTALEHLRIEECEELVEVGTLPNVVKKLQLIDCPKLKKIERLCGFAKLQTLNVSRRKDVEELPSIEGKSERLAESRGKRALSNLDSSFDKCLLCLQHLELHNTAISEVSFPTGVCPNLQHLDIKDCEDLIEVRTLPNALIKLQLYNCPKLKLMSIADLAQVMQLREIRVHLCNGLEELLGVGYLKSLEVMQVSGCMKLKSITGLEQLTQLRELVVSNCCELKELLGVGHLKSLEVLQASGCAKLKSILGVDQLTQLRKLDVPFNMS